MLFGFLVSTGICLTMLILSLPAQCWSTVRMNCRRLDGTCSWRRLRREVLSFCNYGMTLAVPVLLMFLTVFVVTTLLFGYVIPFDLIVSSFSEFDVDPQTWRSNLHRVRQAHQQFLSSRGFDSDRISDIQRMLWYEWPTFVGVGLIPAIVAVVGFIKRAARTAARHAAGIRKRRRMYARFDVLQMQTAVDSSVHGPPRNAPGPSTSSVG